MPHPVDIHVGKRIRQVRWLKGMTQQQLAQEVGVKFQQMQKYETGANRVSASRLWQLSAALQVPVSFFFDALPEEAGGGAAAGFCESDSIYDRESMEMVRAYQGLDANLRSYFLNLVKAIPRHDSKTFAPGATGSTESVRGKARVRKTTKTTKTAKKSPRR